jgi:hypothetical protein
VVGEWKDESFNPQEFKSIIYVIVVKLIYIYFQERKILWAIKAIEYKNNLVLI